MKSKIEQFLYDNMETRPVLEKIMQLGNQESKEEISKVYYQGSAEGRKMVSQTLSSLMDERSHLQGEENLKELQDLSSHGKSCLILSEHYSNSDLCNICYFADKALGDNFSERLFAMAGIKLNTDLPVTAAFASPYNRIIIYPSHGIDQITNENIRKEKQKEAMAFNMASMKELIARKNNKQIALVFPSGTRVRLWDDNTKRGVKEIASYVKAFDYICFVSLNGNLLPIDPNNTNMLYDKPTKDLIIVKAHPIIESKIFLAECSSSLPEGVDLKTHIVGQIMKRLFTYHDEVEIERQKELTIKPIKPLSEKY